MQTTRREIPHVLSLVLLLAILFLILPKISLAETITEKFYAGPGDGIAAETRNPITWDNAHDDTNASNVQYTWNTSSDGDSGWGISSLIETYNELWTIERAFFPFNTSGIPDNAFIDKVKFYITGANIQRANATNTQYNYLTVVEGKQDSIYSVIGTDFIKCGDAIDNPAEGSDHMMLEDNQNGAGITKYFTLNSNGKSWISKIGWTKLGIREGHDVEDIAPNWMKDKNYGAGWNIRMSEYSGTSSDPYLEITYTIPDKPEVNFNVVHLTDVHLGSNWVPGSYRWYEEISYPRFTDTLFNIEKLSDPPEFIIVSGDIVEYSEFEWISDFQSLVESYSERTDIPIYVVPGNHDRYRGATGGFQCGILKKPAVNCDDYLNNYFNIISNPAISEANYLIPGNEANYAFQYSGFQFIGLDSGADFWPDYEIADKTGGPEADGLSDAQINALNALATATPKIVFMHSPVMSGSQEACIDSECPTSSVENGSFVNNYPEFLDFIANNNIELILTGHTHEDHVFNSQDYEYDNIPDDIRPLFIQTPSATKGSGGEEHGFRVINIEDGAVNPLEPIRTLNYQKKVAQLLTGDNLELRYYDPNDQLNYITPADNTGLSVPFFTAPATKRAIIYDSVASGTKLEIAGQDSALKFYGLEARQEEVNIPDKFNRRAVGFYIRPSLLSFVSGHIEAGNNLAKLWLKNVDLANNDIHCLLIDWPVFIANRGKSGVYLAYDTGGDGSFDVLPELVKMPVSLSAFLNSPGELRVIDSDNNITGLVNHEPVEDIPFSLYENKEERVTVYLKEGYDNQEFYFEVHGLEDPFDDAPDTYTLTIYLDQDEASTTEFSAIDLPIQPGLIHRYAVDWEELAAGEDDGVQLLIDRDGDGVFEQIINCGEELTREEFNRSIPLLLKMNTVEALKAATTGVESIDNKINTVLTYIESSLDSEFWLDEARLDSAYGSEVFLYEALAVIRLREYLHLSNKSKQHELPHTVVYVFEQALSNLVVADRILAQATWYEYQGSAIERDKEYKNLKKWIEAKLNSALDNESDNQLVAINYYRQVWEKLN